MKKIFLIIPILNLMGCVVIDLIPSYSSYFNEDTWVHRDTGLPLPNDINMYCYNKSIEGFDMIDEYACDLWSLKCNKRSCSNSEKIR